MTPAAFNLLGPLPENTTVLEASAGTGKTYTIASLVARYVAEDVATMDELLVVSFSRESTRELRERVRERLVSARDGLTGRTAAKSGDELLAYLAERDVDERRRRLADAITLFDAATVTTTHGFCQQVLLGLGTAGDYDPGAILVEDIADVVAEVADDLYLRKWAVPDADPPELSPEDFHDLALRAATDPATALVPDPATTGLPGLRARVAEAVRLEVRRRMRRQRLVDYDDMLTRLADTLLDPSAGPVAKARLQGRYRVVLVDEFQDTDPVQWSILREAFHGYRTLVLIGDPKQAIYGFRGADVHAYLEARAAAALVQTLPTNWRSDARLLEGMAAVFRGASLGDPRIQVVPVAAHHKEPLVDVPAAVRLRVLTREVPGLLKVDEARRAIGQDLAAQIVTLLSDGTTMQPRGGGDRRAVLPRDIAVLVRTNSQAQLVQSYLAEVGVPVVLAGKTSVFGTPAAAEWQLLLEALEQPHRTTRVRRFALSCFVGLDAAALDARGDAFADELGLKLRTWGQVLEQRGVAALFESVSMSEQVQPRVLGTVGGERLLTDLRHIAQILHEAALEGQLGLTALLLWLRRRREEAKREGGQERSRRLETDAAAVQVITVHTSKGLEFPVVLVPFAWDRWDPSRPPVTAVFHDQDGRRIRDVGGAGSPDWSDHVRRQRQEETDDELRLTYVALTRAQSHLLLWWAPSTNTPTSPLHRLLLHDDPGAVAERSIAVPSDEAALDAFRARAAASNGNLVVETLTPTPATAWAPHRPPVPRLGIATFSRPLDSGWTRTSYSALTATAHEQVGRFGSEPEVAQKDDETDAEEVETPATEDDRLRTVVSRWDQLPSGPAFGTLVHTVLEELDDAADDDQLRSVVEGQVQRFAPDTDVDSLHHGAARCLGNSSRPVDRWSGAAGHRRCGPTSRARVRAAAHRRRRAPAAAGGARRSRPAVAGALRNRTTVGIRRCARGTAARVAARLSDRQHRRSPPGARRRDREVRRGRLQDQPAGRPGRTADRMVVPTRGDGERHARGALSIAGAAVCGRAASLPALAAAGVCARAAPGRCAVPVPARHVRPGCPGRSRRGPRRVRLATSGRTCDGRVRPAGGWPMTAALTAAVAVNATGLLGAFNRAGILSVADVHVARRLGVISGETDDAVLLAAALVVRSTRHGSVVVDLETAETTTSAEGEEDTEPDDDERAPLSWPDPASWGARVAASPLAGGPLRVVGSRLWLARYWDQEELVASELLQRSASPPDDLDDAVLTAGLDRLFATGDDDQRAAAESSARNRISVIAGGPGTGKTTTVSRLLALLREQHPSWRIALAAPTGKAAARLEEAVRSSAALLAEPDRARLGELPATTLHRLLGWRPDARSRFRHDRTNRLPVDVVVVDETSMVSLTLMARLLEALRPATRLVLVGDPDQLASVEAGAVLSDLVDSSGESGARALAVGALSTNRRFPADSRIGQLAAAVQTGRASDALTVARAGGADIEFIDVADDDRPTADQLASLRADVQTSGRALLAAAEDGDAVNALHALERHRLLCAHRHGPRGVDHWGPLAARWVADVHPITPRADGRYAGEPLLVTTNDYDVGLYNGDTGVVVSDGGAGLVAAFGRGGRPIMVPLVRLGAIRPLNAMTVHRSQGSQFARITVVLPPARSPLATRQTLYTALTRATTHVRIIGSADAIAAAVDRPAARATGLRERLSS